MRYKDEGQISEIIVVDGYSDDGTRELIGRYPVMVLLEGGGWQYEESVIRKHYAIYSALDQGWRAGRGDLVMFLDSDAYLGERFFPEAVRFFIDHSLGVLGCWARAWVTTPQTETMDQLWAFHAERIRDFQEHTRFGLFSRLYAWVAGNGLPRLVTSGPCYIVRRVCLEALGGHDAFGDLGVGLRLGRIGYRSWWWVDAPVYHLPKETLVEFFRQRYLYGLIWAALPGASWRVLISPLRILGATALGVILAARFRNVRHLVALPLGEWFLLLGFLIGLCLRIRGTR
jgi:cellulose synthase/poly-beta-1,6-N-acetylglucosamine synthase-like glycosyltransferase